VARYFGTQIQLPADPASPMQATTKQYADRKVPWAPITLTDATTIATDASLGNYFRVTLAGNRTLSNPTNLTDGQRITWEVIQDATGSRTLAYDTLFAFGTDLTGAVLTTTANKRDFIGGIYNSVTSKIYVVSFIKGY
jgi:hypothetical protein